MKRPTKLLRDDAVHRAESPLRARLGNERGSGMVEFAFVAVMLVTLFFGIGAFGYGLFVFHGVSNLARDATRWAAVNGYNCNSDRNTTASTPDVGSCTAPITFDSTTGTYSLCTATTGSSCSPATTGDIQDYVLMRLAGLNPKNIKTTVKYPSNVDNASVCTTTDNAPGCTVEVKVSYTFTFPLIFVTKPITLTSSSEMIIAH